MKKILLVNPWIYDFAAYDFWLKPLGLLYIGSILKNLGFEIFLIDLLNRYDKDLIVIKKPKDKYYGTGKFYSEEVEKPDVLKNIPRRYKRYGIPKSVFYKKLKNIEKPDYILITSVMTYWYYGVKETVEFLREFFPDIPIFVGGIYVSIMSNHAKKTFEKYNVNVCPGTDLKGINCFLENINVPKLDFDWFEDTDIDYSLYDSDLSNMVFLSTIGCPFKCTYCMTPIMWKFRARSVKKVIKNIENALSIKYVKDIAFFDDAFLLNPNLEELLIALKSFHVNFHLPNGVHARLVSKKIAKLLKTANFKIIKLGYETSDPYLQEITGGKVYDKDLEKAAKNLLEAGFTSKDVAAYIMINLPKQKKQDVLNAIDFCAKIGITPSINEFTPIPGTVQYHKLIKEGMLNSNVDPLLLNNSIMPYWWKHGMSIEEIEELKNYANKIKKEVFLFEGN